MTDKEGEDKSWIKKLWDSTEEGGEKLIGDYSEHQLKILFDKRVEIIGANDDRSYSWESFIISRDCL